MSAFGGKADITFCGNPLLRSLLGVKRTWLGAPHMSAFDPKRTWQLIETGNLGLLSDAVWRPLPHNSTPDHQDDYCSDDSAD
jgi:hypothetical protein